MRYKIASLILIFVITTFSVVSLSAQITFEKRIESDNSDGFVYEEIYEFGERGLIKKSRSEKSKSGNKEWKFELLDVNLEIQGFSTIELDKSYLQDEIFIGKDKIHVLFRSKRNYKLMSLDIATMEDEIVEFELPKRAGVAEICVLNNLAICSAVLKGAPYLFSINISTGKQNYIPIKIGSISSKDIDIENLQLLEEEQEVIVFVKSIVRKGNDKISVVRLDKNTKVIETFDFSTGLEHNIVSISAFKIGSNSFIYTGTYSKGSSFSSTGFFYAKKQDDELLFIKYFNFLDLENFLSYLPERKQEKLEKKKERKEKKGKELIINYQIAVHDIVPVNDGFIFIGEAYYPTYRTETRTTYVNGRPTTTTTQVFDGYFYTHALVSKFDSEGNLVWDRTFELRPRNKPHYAKLFISLLEKSENSLDMVFPSSNTLVFKSIEYDGTVKQERESEIMETLYEEDKVYSSSSDLDYWYGNYFINYGTQRIKNKEEEGLKKKRLVFYISKIKFDPGYNSIFTSPPSTDK